MNYEAKKEEKIKMDVFGDVLNSTNLIHVNIKYYQHKKLDLGNP